MLIGLFIQGIFQEASYTLTKLKALAHQDPIAFIKSLKLFVSDNLVILKKQLNINSNTVDEFVKYLLIKTEMLDGVVEYNSFKEFKAINGSMINQGENFSNLGLKLETAAPNSTQKRILQIVRKNDGSFKLYDEFANFNDDEYKVIYQFTKNDDDQIVVMRNLCNSMGDEKQELDNVISFLNEMSDEELNETYGITNKEEIISKYAIEDILEISKSQLLDYLNNFPNLKTWVSKLDEVANKELFGKIYTLDEEYLTILNEDIVNSNNGNAIKELFVEVPEMVDAWNALCTTELRKDIIILSDTKKILHNEILDKICVVEDFEIIKQGIDKNILLEHIVSFEYSDDKVKSLINYLNCDNNKICVGFIDIDAFYAFRFRIFNNYNEFMNKAGVLEDGIIPANWASANEYENILKGEFYKNGDWKKISK